MAFCPFLSFKQKNLNGVVYDETGSSVTLPPDPPPASFTAAVFKPTGYSYFTDVDNSDFDTDGFFVCPQSTRCQQWAGTDCGLKSPAVAEPRASAATLLNEFLGGSDLDDLDLMSLGVSGSVYGQDFMIDDDANIPVILKAANDHPDFDAASIVDTIESGRCEVTVDQAGNDSTAEWIFDVTVTDGTTDFIASGIEDTTTGDTGMYIVIEGQGAFQIDVVDSSIALTLRLGYSDSSPLDEGSFSFKVDPKRILWEEYLGLFEET